MPAPQCPTSPASVATSTNLSSALIPLLTAGEELTLVEKRVTATAGGEGRSLSPLSSPLTSLSMEGASPLPGKTVTAPATPFDFRQQWRIPLLLKRLRTEGPALYHSPYYLMPYRPGLPTLLTFYDIIPLKFPRTVPARARLFFRLAATLALRASDHIVAISEAARNDLSSCFRVPASRITVTPLAAGAHYKPQPAAEIGRVRDKYDLPDRFLLYFGINKPHKNLPALIDAYAQIASQPAPPLVIAGAWDDRYPQPKQPRRPPPSR